MLLRFNRLAGGFIAHRKDRPPPQRHLVAGPSLGDVRSIAQQKMNVIAHHSIAAHLNAEYAGELAKPTENPLLTVVIVTASVGVDATKESPADASRDAVVNAHAFFIDNIVAGTGRHEHLRH